ncbi:hypothetical protein WPS_16060 [Vulcanimicrobium alpinum]|uniref:Peptidase S8/S53 domain-containing protein n=1 Tax=Vulcanimicrobium alpinum TaxID=3016050 RepID=A0AAN2C9A3_UNVUL|nr:S8 family serine peptidase [Vulcanimicrobium alpinum]BDE06330.1 hypothetical protein WPS_16060 [Vulcanimicrobium alpinum]
MGALWFGLVRSSGALLVMGLTLSACGGGGGGSSTPSTPAAPTPTPSPTPAPGTCATLPATAGGSTYTLTSDPTGIAVTRANAGKLQCTYFTGVTTTTDAPQSAPNLWAYEFGSLSNNPFTVTIQQTSNGPHTIYYNQPGDSSGAIVTSSLQSSQRAVASVVGLGANEPHRGVRRFTGTGVDPTQVLVRYRTLAESGGRAIASRVEAAAGTRGVDAFAPAGIYQRFVAVPSGADTTSFASALRSRTEVADVFPVHKRVPLSVPPTTIIDPHGNNRDQWYLFDDGFPYAWSYSKGDGAVIASIDTGVDLKNTDLSSKVIYSIGYVTGSAQDTNGHGTNTASIAVAATNNAFGFAGGGYNVALLAYNIFPDATATSDSQTASTSDEVKAIQDAVARKADVISLSLGAAANYYPNDGFDQGEHDAVEAAIAAGVTVVAAAGNDADGSETGTPHTSLDYPAAYDGVIAVGASALRTSATDTLASSTEYVTSYSQYGPNLGVVAPGGDPPSNTDQDPLHWIWNYSTSTANYAKDKCSTPSPATSCSAYFAGTSQATPQVAAVAALMIAKAGGHGSLSPARVAQIIDGTADNINDPHQGHGRLNAYRALASVAGDSGAVYTGPSPQKTSPGQLVAFAYQNSGGVTPTILDVDYPAGIPVSTAGTFRIGDVPYTAGSYKVGVWYDANGDGKIDAGDQFGSAGVICVSTAKCTIPTITMSVVSAGFVLP